MGRTGRMWAIEHSGVQPDVLISAKGIASGLPLGAFMARGAAHGEVGRGRARLHLRRLSRPLRRRACHPGGHRVRGGCSPAPPAVGGLLLDCLRELWHAHPGVITDVRGAGLMIGVELRTAALAELVQLRAFERGLLVLECGESSVRVSPPLVFTRDQAAAALKILAEVFGAVG